MGYAQRSNQNININPARKPYNITSSLQEFTQVQGNSPQVHVRIKDVRLYEHGPGSLIHPRVIPQELQDHLSLGECGAQLGHIATATVRMEDALVGVP